MGHHSQVALRSPKCRSWEGSYPCIFSRGQRGVRLFRPGRTSASRSSRAWTLSPRWSQCFWCQPGLSRSSRWGLLLFQSSHGCTAGCSSRNQSSLGRRIHLRHCTNPDFCVTYLTGFAGGSNHKDFSHQFSSACWCIRWCCLPCCFCFRRRIGRVCRRSGRCQI